MIAVDTNVVVRLLTVDEPDQADRAKRLFAAETVYLSKTVLLETEWVLRKLYGLRQEAVTAALRKLIALESLRTEDADTTRLALDWADAGLDFADALHLASAMCTGRFATFDHKLKKRADSLHGIEVVEP
jgi:predicted nucleic-acid-binding protein